MTLWHSKLVHLSKALLSEKGNHEAVPRGRRFKLFCNLAGFGWAGPTSPSWLLHCCCCCTAAAGAAPMACHCCCSCFNCVVCKCCCTAAAAAAAAAAPTACHCCCSCFNRIVCKWCCSCCFCRCCSYFCAGDPCQRKAQIRIYPFQSRVPCGSYFLLQL